MVLEKMKENILIKNYIKNDKLDIEKIMNDYTSYLYTILERYVPNTNFIYKVAAGVGWHSGIVYVFFPINRMEQFGVGGDSQLGELDCYIRENGYSFDSINFKN